MRILIFTGNSGLAMTLAAAATASVAAQMGRRTLLLSTGPSHNIGSLLHLPIATEPQPAAPRLDVWALDVLDHLGRFWEQARAQMPSGLNVPLSGDELPLVPGLDLFLALERLRQPPVTSYDLVVVDAGSHDTLLRTLAAPDSFRWGLRLLFGLDRGPGRSSASIGRALVPTALLPFEWVSRVQDARVQLEQARDAILDARRTTARYVLRPDPIALQDALVALPALHLHGLAVDAVVVGPLLPSDVADGRLAAVGSLEQEVLAMVEHTWAPRPVLRLPHSQPVDGIAGIHQLGEMLYAGAPPESISSAVVPIEYYDGVDPFVSINLPGLPREALGLTLSGDELIVRVGPYRRHLLLPDSLRGTSNIRASREGDRLVVRLRQVS